MIARLQRAVNAHDLDAMAACFQVDYASVQPIHPDRAFRGRAQMRANWTQIFGAVPDLTAEVLRSAVDGETVWTEWDLRGTRRDGAPHQTVMVNIAGVREGAIAWMRLYLEPVAAGAGIDAGVRESLARAGAHRSATGPASGLQSLSRAPNDHPRGVCMTRCALRTANLWGRGLHRICARHGDWGHGQLKKSAAVQRCVVTPTAMAGVRT